MADTRRRTGRFRRRTNWPPFTGSTQLYTRSMLTGAHKLGVTAEDLKIMIDQWKQDS
jgi:hypothetical protein